MDIQFRAVPKLDLLPLDINNSVLASIYKDRSMKYQLIQHRLLEPKDSEPNLTRDTLDGDIAPNAIAFDRLCSATAMAYCAPTSSKLIYLLGKRNGQCHFVLLVLRKINHKYQIERSIAGENSGVDYTQ